MYCLGPTPLPLIPLPHPAPSLRRVPAPVGTERGAVRRAVSLELRRLRSPRQGLLGKIQNYDEGAHLTQGSLRFTLGYRRPALRASRITMGDLSSHHSMPSFGDQRPALRVSSITTGNHPPHHGDLSVEFHGRPGEPSVIKRIDLAERDREMALVHRRHDCDSSIGVA